ncbi:MAG: RNA pseudouridine synthase [Planctomycetes bacterium]|nr:RNA pseudouridine synthase [Planctomycetota bacterium]
MFSIDSNFTPIFSNPDFYVFNKPPGMETVSQDGGSELVAAARQSLAEPGLEAVHRLDRDTSGAQLVSRTANGQDGLTALFRRREVDKTYLALCLGAPRNRSGTINRNLSEWSGGRRPVRVLKRGGLEASTFYRVLARGTAPGGLPVGLVAFSPHQGRTHQIRVHAAALGTPILGDDQYGDRPANRAAKQTLNAKRQMLHSWRLEFPWKGSLMAVEAAPYPDLMAAMVPVFGEEILKKIADGC